MKKNAKEIKEIEVIEAEPINVLETIKVSALIDVSSWKEKQLKLVAENPFFEITDNKTYEAGKKHRTNVVKGRTELQNQDKLVASKFATIRKEVGTETATLIEITQPLEDQWQEAVKAWEERKAKQKEEEEAAEALRIKTINDKIDETETSCYEIIQKMTFSEIDFAKTQLFAFFTIDFDFEEYYILFEQVKSRVELALENKIASLTVSENQRLDNIRLEEEAAEYKRLADLQAERLTAIMPYVAFGQTVDLTKLSELTKGEWELIFEAKKHLFDASVLANKKIEDKRIAKEEEEKEAIYEIRKKRLEESGMLYSDEHGTFWLKEEPEYILCKEDVFEYSSLDIEETISEVQSIIKAFKEKIEKEKVFDIRKNRLLGLEPELDFNIPVFSFYGYSFKEIYDADSTKFEKIYGDAMCAIDKAKSDAEEAEKQRAVDLKLAEEDAAKLKSENKARVKRLSDDKFSLSDSLNKIGELVYSEISAAKFENEETEIFRQTIDSKFAILIEGLLTELNNI